MADRSGYFEMGELSQRAKDGIRLAGEAGGSPDELAAKTLEDKGLDPNDVRLREDFTRRFHWTLGRLQRDGRVDKLGHGKGVRWKIRNNVTY